MLLCTLVYSGLLFYLNQILIESKFGRQGSRFPTTKSIRLALLQSINTDKISRCADSDVVVVDHRLLF